MKFLLLLTVSLSIHANEGNLKLNKKLFDEYMMVKDHIEPKPFKAQAKAYIFNTNVKKSNYTKVNIEAVYVDPY